MAEAASVATSPSSTGWNARSSAPESERASSSRSSTSEVMWPTSASMSSSAWPTSATGWSLVQPEVLDAGADDGQRRAQLVARVSRELALAPERVALGRAVTRGWAPARGSRRRRPGCSPATSASTPPPKSTRSSESSGLDLGRPVLDDLDDAVATSGPWHDWLRMRTGKSRVPSPAGRPVLERARFGRPGPSSIARASRRRPGCSRTS